MPKRWFNLILSYRSKLNAGGSVDIPLNIKKIILSFLTDSSFKVIHARPVPQNQVKPAFWHRGVLVLGSLVIGGVGGHGQRPVEVIVRYTYISTRSTLMPQGSVASSKAF